MSLPGRSRIAYSDVPAADVRTAPVKILVAGAHSRRFGIQKIFGHDASCCLIAAGANDVIRVLSDHEDISLVAVDLPHSPTRCAICLFTRAYLPAIPFLLISEENTLDQLACIHCPRNCRAKLANRSLTLNTAQGHQMITPSISLRKSGISPMETLKGLLQ